MEPDGEKLTRCEKCGGSNPGMVRRSCLLFNANCTEFGSRFKLFASLAMFAARPNLATFVGFVLLALGLLLQLSCHTVVRA